MFHYILIPRRRLLTSRLRDSLSYLRSLLDFYVYVLGVNHAFVFLLLLAIAGSCAIAGTRRRFRTTCAWRALLLLRPVHNFSQLVRSLGKPFTGCIHGCRIRAFKGFLCISHRGFNLALLRAGDLVAMLFQHLFDLVEHAVELI